MLKRKKEKESIYINCTEYIVDREIAREFDRIRSENRKLYSKIDTLERKIEAIEPVIKIPKLKPAVSLYCKDCKFAVLSTWDNSIIGCGKEVTCDDFKRSD